MLPYLVFVTVLFYVYYRFRSFNGSDCHICLDTCDHAYTTTLVILSFHPHHYDDDDDDDDGSLVIIIVSRRLHPPPSRVTNSTTLRYSRGLNRFDARCLGRRHFCRKPS